METEVELVVESEIIIAKTCKLKVVWTYEEFNEDFNEFIGSFTEEIENDWPEDYHQEDYHQEDYYQEENDPKINWRKEGF